MALLEHDSPLWQKDPSGLKHGDLKAWRDTMFNICPYPDIGTIVVVENQTSGKKIGYRCKQPDGYNTIWERVSQADIEGSPFGFIDGTLVTINDSNRSSITETMSGIPCTEEGVYLCDGVYIDPDDCWF